MNPESPHEPLLPLLVLDCSQRESVVGLATGGGRVLERRFTPLPADPEERLWIELGSLLSEAGIRAGDLAAVAVAIGPGGFTGLRVSIALAQGLGLSLGVPVVGIPSAAVFAHARALEGARGPWLVALAAKDGSAWCATVGGEEGADASVSSDDGAVDAAVDAAVDGAVLDEAGFAARLAALDTTGAESSAELLADGHLPEPLRACARAHGLDLHEPRSGAAALVAEARLRLAKGTGDPATLLPIYAREPEAVTKWRARKDAAGRTADAPAAQPAAPKGAQELRDP